MVAGFQNDTSRALHRLRREQSGYIARQTNFHAAFGKRFENDVCERRPAYGKTGHCVHVLFIKDNRPADGVEHASSDFEMLGARMSSATDCSHPAADSG